MKFIYVLEDDERTQKDLFETLQNIDPKLVIRFFTDLAQFHEWLKNSLQEGPKALAKGGQKYKNDTSEDVEPSDKDELRLVIAKNEFMGVQNMGLIKRAREFFVRKKMCSEQEPTALVLTAFDSPSFDISLAEERIVNNVIFKPFDKLILKQHLEYALTGHHPVTTGTVASMKIQSTIEMLKEVSLNSLTEVGFTTLNNHAIKIGALTKYYSDSFKSNNKRSIFASCKSCKELSPTEFLCEFQFFAADNEQIGHIRRSILQDKAHDTKEIQNTSTAAPLRILILDEEAALGNDLKMTLQEKMANIDPFVYTHVSQLLSDLADKETVHRQQIPAEFDLVFASHDIFEVEKEKRWEMIKKALEDRAKKHNRSFKAPDLILIARKKIQLDEVKNIAAWAKEIFFAPLDKAYFQKKMISLYSNLANKEPASLTSKKDTAVLKVANPVEITQISEAGLILKYYRAMSIGAFREFVLWRPEELETPEIIGTVNFTEKEKNGEAVLNHFVFFGMKDLYLKHIRLWLREAYIKTKEKG